MKVFVTGGSGFVGSAVIPELIEAGHEVVALSRSDSSSQKIRTLGATPLNGSLTDRDSLQQGASAADGIIHLAYIHDRGQTSNAAKTDRNAITDIADTIQGSGKPFIITSGVTGIFGKSQTGSELEKPQTNFITGTRVRAEQLLLSYADKGIRAMVIRLSPFVHGRGDKAFTSTYVSYAQKNNEAVYVSRGENIWPAVHRLDAAHLYRLALENGKTGSIYHAVSEGVTAKEAATAVSEKLDIPLRKVNKLSAVRRLSLFSVVVSLNTPANSLWTQEELGWKTVQPDLVSELREDFYYSGGVG